MGHWHYLPLDGLGPQPPVDAAGEDAQTEEPSQSPGTCCIVVLGLLLSKPYLPRQIVDVKFDKALEPAAATSASSSTVAEDSTLQERTTVVEKAKCLPSFDGSDQDDLNPFLAEDLFDADEDVCLPTIFEDQPAPCSSRTDNCDDTTARPKCQAFPYQQANPVDLVPQEPCVSDASEPLFDHDEQMPDYARSNSEASCDTGSASAIWSTEASGSSATSLSSRSGKADASRRDVPAPDDGLTHLDSLDFLLVSKQDVGVADAGFSGSSSGGRSSPSLDRSRSKLRDKIKSLAHQVESNPNGAGPHAGAGALRDLKLNGGYGSKGLRLVHQPLSARPLGCTKLLKRRQLELWRNYTEKVAPWLDVSGSKRHFQHTIPLLAKAADYLHYAVLAVSARHLELQDTGRPGTESAGLYADAVQLLLPAMHTLDTPVVAACMLLCMTEMMSSPSHLCRDSLRSCAVMMELADFNARSTGIQQSLFWSFANLAVWGGLAPPLSPALSMRLFYPSESLATATSYIRSQTWGEGYAKYALFLTTSIVEVVSNDGIGFDSPRGTTELTRWKVLFDLLEDWYNCRPEEMQALMSYPSILDDYRHPFPMVLYGSAAAIVGNLLYHAAAILLLQQKPAMVELAKNHKSLLWHARQICGIVAENHERGTWPCVPRPLWVAGKVISNELEREKIVEMLSLVHTECGWVTSWYADDLRLHWHTD